MSEKLMFNSSDKKKLNYFIEEKADVHVKLN